MKIPHRQCTMIPSPQPAGSRSSRLQRGIESGDGKRFVAKTSSNLHKGGGRADESGSYRISAEAHLSVAWACNSILLFEVWIGHPLRIRTAAAYSDRGRAAGAAAEGSLRPSNEPNFGGPVWRVFCPMSLLTSF